MLATARGAERGTGPAGRSASVVACWARGAASACRAPWPTSLESMQPGISLSSARTTKGLALEGLRLSGRISERWSGICNLSMGACSCSPWRQRRRVTPGRGAWRGSWVTGRAIAWELSCGLMAVTSAGSLASTSARCSWAVLKQLRGIALLRVGDPAPARQRRLRACRAARPLAGRRSDARRAARVCAMAWTRRR